MWCCAMVVLAVVVWSWVASQTSISTCFGNHYAHHQEIKTVYYRVWYSALVVLAVIVWSWDAGYGQHNQFRTPYAVILSLFLLKMGIIMPETC